MSKRRYYGLFSCDEWKSHSSMNLIGVFTLTKLRKLVKERVKKGDFEFGGERITEIDNMDFDSIDTMLTYGYIIELGINEEL